MLNMILNVSRSQFFRPDIQGLRAVAVLAVVLSHAGLPGDGGGYIGVDVFFVISGFLITSHLASELSNFGSLDFARFYARRIRRILPASFVVLAASVAGVLLLLPPMLKAEALRDALATALYVPNYVFAVRGTDYLANPTPSVFQHFWSLGVEEQFYLAWPLLLAMAWWFAGRIRKRRREGTRAVLTIVVAAVIIGSFAGSIYAMDGSQPWAFFSVGTRAWELSVGALVFICGASAHRQRPAVFSTVLGWIGVGGIAAACLAFNASTSFPGIAALLPVTSAAAVIATGTVPARYGPAAFLSARPFQFIGRISYSLYLVHWPLLQFVQARVGYDRPLPLWATLALALFAIPLAWVLNRFIEEPTRHSRVLASARPRRTLLVAALGTAALAAMAVGALSVGDAGPPASMRAVTAEALTSPPIATPFVPSNLRPSLEAGGSDAPATFSNGCEVGFASAEPHPCSFGGTAKDPVVMLWGDSVAAHWQPAFESALNRLGYRLITNTKSGCASTLVVHVYRAAPYRSCDAWRKKILGDLRAHPPFAVVLANYAGEELPEGSASTVWARGFTDTVGHIPPQVKVIALAGTPSMGANVIGCLSANLGDTGACAIPRATALGMPGRSAIIAAATHNSRVSLVDLTDVLCTATSCPPVIGNLLVYRDAHHLTASFSRALGPMLSQRLAPLLAK